MFNDYSFLSLEAKTEKVQSPTWEEKERVQKAEGGKKAWLLQHRYKKGTKAMKNVMQ